MTGVAGEVLEPTTAGRGEPSSRTVVGDFTLRASAVIVSSGGIGANHDLVRRYWPGGPDAAPAEMLSGVPDSTDGLMLERGRAGRRPDHQPRPDVALPGGRRTTTRRSGPGTASGSCPGRARCGWTRSAGGCRRRCSPGSTPSARCGTSSAPVSRIPGSCSTWTPSVPSSACPDPSRTRTSPRSRSSCCSPPGPAARSPHRCGRSWTRASTS